MPSKGTTYLTGPRNFLIDKDFCNRLRSETGLELTDNEIKEIIVSSNEVISEFVANSDDAFKLPENIGYIAVTKYKSKKQSIDWINTRKYNKIIPLLNLHSFGYICHIKWFKKSNMHFGTKQVFKFVPCRTFSRTVAHNFKNGKNYHVWENSDFLNLNKLYKKIDIKNGSNINS